MKEKKKSAVSWMLTWAGQKRIAYVWSFEADSLKPGTLKFGQIGSTRMMCPDMNFSVVQLRFQMIL